MCFSVNVNLIKEEIESRYGATLIDRDKYRPSYYYHAFAIPQMPVICSDDRSLIRVFAWGLIPNHTRNIEEARNIRTKTFNARGESIDEKSSFSESFRSRRCIVPVKGFYEWQHVGKDKIPWYIYHADDEIISLAGLYDRWIENATGEIHDTFTIVTTTANELLAEIHNSALRMPLILPPGDEKLWIDPSLEPGGVRSLIRPSASGMLKAHTIGPLVNDRNADRNTPEVIRPYPYHRQNSLF